MIAFPEEFEIWKAVCTRPYNPASRIFNAGLLPTWLVIQCWMPDSNSFFLKIYRNNFCFTVQAGL